MRSENYARPATFSVCLRSNTQVTGSIIFIKILGLYIIYKPYIYAIAYYTKTLNTTFKSQ